MRPVGEVEFVNGVAAMSASGIYGKTRVAAGIAGHADLTLGSRVEPVLAARIRAGGGHFRSHEQSSPRGIRRGYTYVSGTDRCHSGLAAPRRSSAADCIDVLRGAR